MAPTALFQAQVHDAVFANPTADFGTAKLAALNTTPIFAAAVSPELAYNLFSDSLQDGTDAPLTPSAPPAELPDPRFDFIPADVAIASDC